MTRVNNFVENGGRLCRTLARSVWVDVDPNVQKKIWEFFCFFFREVTPDSPSPRKPHINTGIHSKMAWENQMPVWGCVWCALNSPVQCGLVSQEYRRSCYFGDFPGLENRTATAPAPSHMFLVADWYTLIGHRTLSIRSQGVGP